MTIQVLVCDLGKVLLPFDEQRIDEALRPYCSTALTSASPSPAAMTPAAARAALYALAHETQFGSGGIGGADLFKRWCAAVPLQLTYEAFCVALSDMFWVDEAALQLVTQAPVRRRYLLSNTNEIHWDFIRQRYPTVLQPFDHLVVSHEIGLEKPDRRIYEWVIRASGYPPAAHLFIDDIEVNVIGARVAGMDAIHFTGAAHLEKEFASRGLIQQV